jgi:ADP-ribosylation factor GTPase-activating protein 2/3
MQQYLDNAERDAILEKLRTLPDNNKCLDCEKKNPKWASVYLGIFLCLDCAGKHREYSIKYSFVRSLTLDGWSKRQITFLEIGGNAKAAEYFRKNGLKAPIDYKSQVSQKYQTELIKKVDALLSSMQPMTQTTQKEETSNSEDQTKKEEENTKPEEIEKPSNDMFANNVIINPSQVKAKGFSVEFSSNKPAFSAQKKGLAAKKIDNFDLDSLTLEEDSKSKPTTSFGMTDSSFGLTNNDNGVKEVSSKTSYTTYSNEPNNDEKLKKFTGAKAISSESFKDKSDYQPADVKRFSGASSISSNQYFGYKEEDNSQKNYGETVDNVKEFVTQIGGKLKEKAGGFLDKVKTQWNERGSG